MPATAIVTCPNDCLRLTYTGSIDDPDTDDRDFVNRLGLPVTIARQGSDCPNCGEGVTIDWGDDR